MIRSTMWLFQKIGGPFGACPSDRGPIDLGSILSKAPRFLDSPNLDLLRAECLSIVRVRLPIWELPYIWGVLCQRPEIQGILSFCISWSKSRYRSFYAHLRMVVRLGLWQGH